MIGDRLNGSAARLAPLLAVAILLSGSTATAQEAPEPPDRDCVCAFGTRSAAPWGLMRTARARIGITMGDARTIDGRTGVRIEQVDEGGPAARAGLLAGDVVLALNDVPLGDEPAARLLDLMADVEAGDTVAVEYHRDGVTRTARVTAEAWRGMILRAAGTRLEAFPRGDAELFRGAMREIPSGRFEYRTRDGLGLVEMNAGLGEYFGVSEGVLVTRAGPEALGLRAGDVILSIGGRAVRDAAHARTIIGSFRADEEIAFEVQRSNRRTTVRGRVDR